MHFEKDKVSVIVPVYNCEQYLLECINSILNQSYKNIELILIDDGSTDRSGAVCDAVAKDDERVKVVHKKNEGVSIARNVGIEKCVGEYLYFCDADDIVFSYTIESMKKMLDENQADICMCSFTRKKRYFSEDKFRITNYRIRSEAMDLIYSDPLYGGYVWNKMFRNVKIGNIRFRQDIAFGEDELFCMQYMENVNKSIISSLVVYCYRDNPKGICNSNNIKREVDSYIAKNECRKILMKYGGNEKTILESSILLQKNCTKYFYKLFGQGRNSWTMQKKLLYVFRECYMYHSLRGKGIIKKLAIAGMRIFSYIII